ncbi:threonine dehydrogenase [Nocardia neocaledoniensis NBRC 108232]|uniref:Threonine dehydrogenase-like Zn-dependent dehydrogenase n=1 Tax=Nocardia neocaledoniensis TaxID=236511 RepID=A0A317N950_9NOCA|nr:glucose 1-dehydrogenase [Nocardia neocaledoniensis]PWV71619.1 threonine dehydrogenase-like Zn-dependent dehydrogenase [Nocardia neocaledoniensis]GEM29195.1 threonine dehydrogenase [Nocardia neocaledoniensis NBRC 108232]
MRALTVIPNQAGSLSIAEVPDPQPGPDELLVDGVALGICGTDREIAEGSYGWAPPGRERLVLGHESLGRVRTAPDGSGFAAGDLVVGIVRRPDPVPCGACARGEFDMCRNGQYVERGIKQIDGFGSTSWVVPVDYAVKLDPALEQVGVLMEPTTVVAKAWDQIERINQRAWFEPKTAMVTGAGPIGLLAALLGVQRGLDVHVLDRTTEGPKPGLVADLGATFHTGSASELAERIDPDVVIEATGAPAVALDAAKINNPGVIVCLTGVSTPGSDASVDVGALNRNIVLDNALVFGSVNANRHHYELAAQALAKADAGWLGRLITRRLPLERALEAFDPGDHADIKVVIDL